MTTATIVRQAGERCGFNIGRSLQILEQWSDPKAWTRSWNPAEKAMYARSGARVLRGLLRDGSRPTHYAIDQRSGRIYAVVASDANLETLVAPAEAV